jgi:hypothetical protein
MVYLIIGSLLACGDSEEDTSVVLESEQEEEAVEEEAEDTAEETEDTSAE